jgi:hypothetical protein
MTLIEQATDDRQARAEFTAGLRAAADWFDTHPELPVPYEATPGHHSGGVRFSIGIHGSHVDPDETVPGAFAAAVMALGGARIKDADDAYMRVTRRFGPGVNVEIWAVRAEVCEAVVVGTETVIEDEVVTPAVTRRVETTRDVIEWRCAPLLQAVQS